MNIPKIPKNLLVIGLIVIAALVLFGGGLGNLFGGGNQIPQTGANQGQLGDMFVAEAVDQGGCPVGETNRLAANQPIYVGVERSQIPAGTTMFARLNYEGEPVEDAPQITADQAMQTCVWFEFQPVGQAFEPGNYSAEIFVNGNRAGEVRFAVDNTQSGALNSGALAGVDLGRAYTAVQVNDAGCPVETANQFFTDEQIFVGFEQSYIPAGTTMFARLLFQGEPVEDTDEIRSERDMDTCAWFVFEPVGGFTPGNYEVELYVNGELAERLPIQVTE